MTVPVSQCAVCKHLVRDAGRTCEAFPQGIPEEIITNRFDHRQEYPGDKGVRFAEMTDADMLEQVGDTDALPHADQHRSCRIECSPQPE